MNEEIIKFYLNGKSIVAKKFKKTDNLKKVRLKLEKTIIKGIVFCFKDGAIIDEDEENEFNLEEITNNGIVFLKLKNAQNYVKTNNINEGNINPPLFILNTKEQKDIKRKSNKKIPNQEKEEKFPKRNIPIRGYQLLESKNGLNIYLYPSAKFKPYEECKAISLMVVGETGCGKTTLLNSFVNSLLGVKFEDNFRYKIINENIKRNQSRSQTEEVTCYNIRSIDGFPPIKIIDTPGYGDTQGIKKDKIITEKIKDVFTNQISTLNAICFVAKSSNNRLTPSQKYIFNSILDLFGEDVKEIFVVMLTFCDGGKPNIIEPLQDKDCIFSKIIPSIKEPWYFKFNNSAIYETNREDPFTPKFWKLGMDNFDDFKNKLITLPRKSLTLSKKVLEERKFLENKVEILNRKLRDGLNKIEEIKQIIKMLKNIKGDLDDCKNFKKTIKVPGIKKIPKNPNYYATTCLICAKTCHSTCYIKDDDNKINCAAMGEDGNCEYCPKKCPWNEHKNRDYILEDIMIDKEITLEDLKQRYNKSQNELSLKKQLLEEAKNEFIDINIECLETQDAITDSINCLHKIALNKSVFESAEEHIDLLIEVEKSEHKEGWQKRIEALEELKEQKKLLREVYQGTNEKINKIRSFFEGEIKEYLNKRFNKSLNAAIRGVLVCVLIVYQKLLYIHIES